MEQLSIDIIEVTPELAAEWLKANTHNRRLNPSTVDDYARDMAAGVWVLNGEAIKISAAKILLDGQHRLAGVVKAGVTVPMLVVQGLPHDTQATMDLGRKRSVGDQLVLDGEQYARNLAAVLRRAWQWDQKNYRFSAQPAPTAAETRATLAKYPSIRRSTEIGHRINNSFRPAKASVAGTAHHLFLQIDPDQTAEFFARLETGADLSVGHPVLALRDRLTQDKVGQRAVTFHQHVAAHIRAWNAFRKDESLLFIRVPSDLKMPMPI